MRNPEDLRFNERQNGVLFSGPSTETITEVQQRFEVRLPESYLTLLSYCNGGRPEVDKFNHIDGTGQTALSYLFHLTTDENDSYGVWFMTDILHAQLADGTLYRISENEFQFSDVEGIMIKEGAQPVSTPNKILAIGDDGGGAIVFIDESDGEEQIYIYYGDGRTINRIAHNFEEFVDSLHL